MHEGPLVEAPDEMTPPEPEPEESPPQWFCRPTGWLTTPKIGVFDADGNLLGEMVFDPVSIYFPHGQGLHQMQEQYVERARARLQERQG